MEKHVPIITKEKVKPAFENKYVKVFDLQYEEGKHYLDATRRPLEELTAIKTDDELKEMIPDAVSCVVILNIKGKEPLLCLTREFRFPAGRFLLSVPAGLIDKADIGDSLSTLFITAEREIFEETGIVLETSDKLTVINPLLFSTPGMTDESNAIVQVVLNRDSMPKMSQDGAEGTECFDGFIMMNKEEALKTLKAGSDNNGIYFSTYTWIALMTFVSGLWQ